jgi:hypothetical protein
MSTNLMSERISESTAAISHPREIAADHRFVRIPARHAGFYPISRRASDVPASHFDDPVLSEISKRRRNQAGDE